MSAISCCLYDVAGELPLTLALFSFRATPIDYAAASHSITG
jgi:hypothetical protein